MSLSRKSNNQTNQNSGELLYYHLKNRYKTTNERKEKIEQIRLTPNGIETIKDAMKIDQAVYDSYQAELQPLSDARRKAAYDHIETHVFDRSEGTTIEVGVGGEAEKLDDLIRKVESKYSPSLDIYKELKHAVWTDNYEREKAIRSDKIAAIKKEAEDEFNNIVEISRARCTGK